MSKIRGTAVGDLPGGVPRHGGGVEPLAEGAVVLLLYSSVHLPIRRQPTSTPQPLWLMGVGRLYPLPLDGGGFGWG
jgi:hypothetical protein